MKVWNGFGSEHSMNLVMIGSFKDAGDAATAEEIIQKLTRQLSGDVEAGLTQTGVPTDRYTDGMLALLMKLNVGTIGHNEVEQFGQEVDVKVQGNTVVLTTEEADVSAFLKVLIHKGARVEVFSAHDHPGTGHGRGQ